MPCQGALKKSDQERTGQMMAARIDKLENVAYVEYQKTAIDFAVEKVAGRKKGNARSSSSCSQAASVPGASPPTWLRRGRKELPARGRGAVAVSPARPAPRSADQRRHRSPSGVLRRRDGARGTPTVLFNGKPSGLQGGGRDDAAERYEEYGEVIASLLEKSTPIKLTASATRKGDKIDIRAAAGGIQNPGDKMRLAPGAGRGLGSLQESERPVLSPPRRPRHARGRQGNRPGRQGRRSLGHRRSEAASDHPATNTWTTRPARTARSRTVNGLCVCATCTWWPSCKTTPPPRSSKPWTFPSRTSDAFGHPPSASREANSRPRAEKLSFSAKTDDFCCLVSVNFLHF